MTAYHWGTASGQRANVDRDKVAISADENAEQNAFKGISLVGRLHRRSVKGKRGSVGDHGLGLLPEVRAAILGKGVDRATRLWGASSYGSGAKPTVFSSGR